MHAEEVGIQKISRVHKKLLNNSTIYIIKLTNDDKCKDPTPCDKCRHIIIKYKIRKVVCFI